MPTYAVNVELYDSAGRTGFKRLETVETDFVTAKTAAGNLVDDLQAITELEVIAYTVSERTVYSGTLTAGANLDEAGVFTVRKADGFKASHRIPGIVQAARQTGTDALDAQLAAVIAYFQNFISGNFTMSDGESVSALLKGVLEK